MTICRKQLTISAFALVALGTLAFTPGLLGGRVGSALEVLGGADHKWLLLGIIGFVGAFSCAGGGWRAGVAGAGGLIWPRRPAARVGIGALRDSFPPAQVVGFRQASLPPTP